MSRSSSSSTPGARSNPVQHRPTNAASSRATPPPTAEEARQVAFRRSVLRDHGATDAQADALLAYNEIAFDVPSGSLPRPDEPFVEPWTSYLEEAAQRRDARAPMLSVLQECLVQLQFPIRVGMSDHPAYRAATRSIEQTDPRVSMNAPHATGLDLDAPEQLTCHLHPTIAGRIPVIQAGTRRDFVRLVQAFLKRNEPAPIPDSMGAVMISGYVNWARVNALRQAWEARERSERIQPQWTRAFRAIPSDTTTYRDRLMLVSPSPYSAVTADDVGVPEERWPSMSVKIRMAHEGAHYITRRICGAMRTALHDEIIADYAGISAVAGRFRGDWFRRFMGLEDAGAYRVGGRLESYRGELCDGAFQVLQRLAVSASRNLEAMDEAVRRSRPDRSLQQHQTRMILGLTQISVEELASRQAEQRLNAALQRTVDPVLS